MIKTGRLITCGLCILIGLATVLCSCQVKPEPEYASEITENILLSLDKGDYQSYCRDFEEEMKEAVDIDTFIQASIFIQSKIGEYQSKEFLRVETEKGYTIVHYTAKFSDEPADVTVSVAFDDSGDRVLVSGLWLASPKLQE